MLFRVLGPLEVRRADGRPVEFTADRQRRLLALLLSRGNDWVSVDDAVRALWPDGAQDGAPAGAPSQVKTHVHHLRQALPRTQAGTPRINGGPDGYRLNLSPDELDAFLFDEQISLGMAALTAGDAPAAVERLRGALALWRGRPFDPLDAGLAGSRIAQLHELRGTAHEALADALLAADWPAEAIALLRPLADADPVREPTWFRLILALDQDGRSSDAIAAYDTLAAALRSAGSEPGPQLRQLHRRLLGEDDGGTLRIKLAMPQAVPEPVEQKPPAQPVYVPPLTDLRPRRARRTGNLEPEDWLPPARQRRFGALGTMAVVAVVAAAALAGMAAFTPLFDDAADQAGAQRPTRVASGPATSTSPLPPGVAPRRAVPGPPAGDDPALLFGVGDRADVALRSQLATSTRTRMLSTWYRGPDDLAGLTAWRESVVPSAYAAGYALHLVISAPAAPVPVNTAFGPGCGRPYPVSERFLDDVRALAAAFAGTADGPPLFVTVFDEVQAFACTPGAFQPDEPTKVYHQALKHQYLQARHVINMAAPNALVSLGWGASQAGYNDPDVGGGVAMFGNFDEVLRWSDFVSVMANRTDDNVSTVRAAVRELGQYAPVMLAGYGPLNGSPAVVDQDVRTMLAEDFLSDAVEHGLFAWSFTSDSVLAVAPGAYQLVAAAVDEYGRPAR